MPALLANNEAFNNAVKNPHLTVVHFSADWVDQCSQVDDVLDTLAKVVEPSQAKFFKCQAEDLSEVSLSHKIEAVPTVILFQAGKVVSRVDGADAGKITDAVKAQLKTDLKIDHKAEPTEAKSSLEDRLKSLINKAPVMLFMKGDRDQPRCGFSKQIIAILNDTGIPYETFDILTDEEVRQGLKTYSDWPTYPQLYVKGELIGGLDIVKEMLASGELESSLKS